LFSQIYCSSSNYNKRANWLYVIYLNVIVIVQVFSHGENFIENFDDNFSDNFVKFRNVYIFHEILVGIVGEMFT